MNQEERIALVEYRISKARETYNEITLHIENRLWNTAVNRLYYACYYAVSALLLSADIKAQTHSGVRQMFGLHFIKTEIFPKELGKFFSDIYDSRQAGDYDDFVDFTEEDIVDMIPLGNHFINEIEKILAKKK